MASSESATRTVLRVRCEDPECSEISETTQAEHPPESPQVSVIESALRDLADDHAEATGHETTVEVEGVDAN